MVLLGGGPPPPDPPLDILSINPVRTDPRRKVYAFEEEKEGWVLRLVWDADEPGVLEGEYRAPIYDRRLVRDQVREFWKAVKEKTAPLGPLPIEGADPKP